MQVYCSKVAANMIAEHGLALQVVTDLCEQHLPQGNNRVLYVDNFFMSLPLSCHLESVGTHCVGTIRSNKKEYPPQLRVPALLKQLKHGEFHTVILGSHVICVWKDARVVSFISNVHSSQTGGTVTRTRTHNSTVNEVHLPVPMCFLDLLTALTTQGRPTASTSSPGDGGCNSFCFCCMSPWSKATSSIRSGLTL